MTQKEASLNSHDALNEHNESYDESSQSNGSMCSSFIANTEAKKHEKAKSITNAVCKINK